MDEMNGVFWIFLLIQSAITIFFLTVQFFIYKSKFNKYAPSDTPSNLKLVIDIVLLSILWTVFSFIAWLIMWLIIGVVWMFGWEWFITIIIILIWYYFILKFLAGRHTDWSSAKKIADQTLVFTILFWILFYLAFVFVIMWMIGLSF